MLKMIMRISAGRETTGPMSTCGCTTSVSVATTGRTSSGGMMSVGGVCAVSLITGASVGGWGAPGVLGTDPEPKPVIRREYSQKLYRVGGAETEPVRPVSSVCASQLVSLGPIIA
jgi:hypothetical protein